MRAMNETATRTFWRPSATTLIAGSLILAGFLLTSVNWWFLLLAAVGTFGPGILREAGLLDDMDEFQREAAYRAGYHAYVTMGVMAFVLVAYFRSGGTFEHPERMASFVLVLLWCSWFLSSLLAYWGPQKTARRVLLAFGSVWLAFTILSNTGSEWNGWAAVLLHPLLAAPFFALAWLSRIWPRFSGVLLLAVASFLAWFMGWLTDPSLERFVGDGLFVVFIGPLIASGIVLLTVRQNTPDDGS